MKEFKQLLNGECKQSKSQQALCQIKARKTGTPSSQQEPTEESFYPSWVFNSLGLDIYTTCIK